MTLCELPQNRNGRILEVNPADQMLGERLVEMGFSPGSIVRLLQRSPWGGPLIFRVNHGTIALRVREAQCIQVEAIE